MKWLLAIVLASGCTGVKDDAWQSLGDRVRDDIVAIRPVAQAILAFDGKTDAASGTEVARLCGSMDLRLQRLADARQMFRAVRSASVPESEVAKTPESARILVEQRPFRCEDPAKAERCRDWCIENWRNLSSSIDELTTRAAKHDVKLGP